MILLNGYALVEMEPQDLEKGGILLDQYAAPKAVRGTVKNVAPGTELTVGQRVLVHPWTGSHLEIKEKPCKILKAEDVLGILE